MTRNKPKICDRRRNNKLCVRNFNEAVDVHDVIRLMLLRKLRKDHPDSDRNPIYTEFDPEHPQETFPDVWMRDQKGDIYVWEIQRNITKEWQKSILKQYEDVNLIIIDTAKIEKEVPGLKKVLEDLRKVLSGYTI